MSASVNNTKAFSIYSLSEGAVTIEFGKEINAGTLDVISDFNKLLHEQPFQGFYSSVPAYTTLTVFFDPVIVRASGDLTGRDSFERVSAYLRQLAELPVGNKKAVGRNVEIPVCYGGNMGPDLEDLAAMLGMSAAEVIRIHSSAEYTVFMIGFVPGFPYLGGLPEAIAAPRRMSPRAAVPAGSVGIAGNQTGIYPFETPGGWQIIGRTPLLLFDAGRDEPSLLKAADRVRFRPVGREEYDDLRKGKA